VNLNMTDLTWLLAAKLPNSEYVEVHETTVMDVV